MKQQEKIYLEAGEWLDLLSEGALTPSEQHQLNAWLKADRLHRSALQNMIATWGDPAVERAFKRWQKEQPVKPHWYTSMSPKSTGLAAVAAIMLLVCIALPFYYVSAPVKAPLLISQAQRVLDDGSHVKLQDSSELLVSFSDKVRSLNLQKGQVYFEVAKDTSRPFVVRVGPSSVTAVGTEFNIDKGSDRIDILVYEGIVKVSPSIDSSPILLEAGQKVSIKNSELGRVEEVALADVIDWRSGWIELDNEPLSFLIERMNRYSPTDIVLLSPDLANERVAGRFRLGDTKQTLNLLEELYRLRIDHTSAQIEIRRRSY